MTAGSTTQVDEDLLSTVAALFPGAELDVGRGAAQGSAFRFVPGVRRARLIVPADAPRAAAGAVDRPSAGDTRRQVVVRHAVGALLRVQPLAALTMPYVLRIGPSTDSFAAYLSDTVGRDVRFSLAIGSRRANRKPVLNVHVADGAELGYAKVGLTALANDLIDHEAAVLAGLTQRPPRTFSAPRLLHHGRWQTSSVLLMESLRPSRQRPASPVLPLAAMAELIGRDGVRQERVGASAWSQELVASGDELRRAGHDDLARLAARYLEAFGELEVPLGRWHGDLGPWNMAWHGATALIWDWERSAPHVPAALDAVHFTCHSSLRDVGNLPRARKVLAVDGAGAVRAVLQRVPDVDQRGVDARLVRAVVLGYLLSVAARFSVDALRPNGDAVERLATWHLTVLRDQLDQEE